MKKILYISQSVFSFNAPGIRVQRIAQELIRIGFQVSFVCTAKYRSSSDLVSILNDITTFHQDELRFDFVMNGSTYYCRKLPSSYIALKGLVDLFFAYNTFKYVKEICLKEKPYAIFLYNDIGPLTSKLLSFCKQHSIKVYADVTEWYEKKNQIRNIADIFVPRMVDYRIRHIDKGLDGVVSISNYLHNHYQKMGVKSVCIPPLMTIDHSYHPKVVESIPLLIYAGSPGEKDLLVPAIKAVIKTNTDSIKLRFCIIGIDKEYIAREYNIQDLSIYGIEAMGRISHEKVINILQTADFSFLLRRNLRYAKAGFSTKLAESLSMGVPVICNSIGGSDSVIKDYYNGYVIKSTDVEDITQCLHSIVNMNKTERQRMRDYAFESSEMFEGSKYDLLLKELLG